MGGLPVAALVVGGLAMLGIVLFFAGLARALSRNPYDVDDRMEHYAMRASVVGGHVTGGARARGRLTRDIDRQLTRRGRGHTLELELAQADLKLTPGEFIVVMVTGVLLAFALGLLIFKQWYVALPCAILGYLGPRWYLVFRQYQRRSAFSGQLPDAISLMSTSLRSGYSLLQSMELLSRELQPPISEEFGRVVREIGLGVAFDQAISNMRNRIRNEDLDLLVTALLIQHEVGGNLSLILDTINHTIRERIRIKGEVRILTTQQQASGYFVGAMPFLLTVLLFVISPAYMGQFFNSLCGQLIFFTVLVLVGSAMLVIRRIISIEV
ncbi:MAG: type II secretion system F family protein [Chloroflexi bacterium]|nr:type II secretion system F family protein [Chloroflexota bacterium]